MKKLINAADSTVDELLDGYLAAFPSLARLDGHKIVLRSDFETVRDGGKVAIISGGGSGHEPAHAGYVGRGMLTAAVCGEVFTSPSTDAVLAALRSVTGPAGTLLIVKNYTGDRLNFGLAAEIARSEGLRVEIVIVGDDAALNGDETAGRRGIAGTILVHKAAGAAAEAGLSLDAVRRAANDASRNIATMGVALRPCIVPGSAQASFELDESEVEFGLGIHGERGRSREHIGTAASIVNRLCTTIFADLGLVAGDRVALMVNNLGSTPPMEISIATREAVGAARLAGLRIERLWSGTFLTALDMAGCSITAVKLTPQLIEAFDAATDAPAWPGPGRSDGTARSIPAASEPPATGRPARKPAPALVTQVLSEVVRAVRGAEAELTELDRRAGDGDLGINLARGAAAIEAELDTMAELHPADILHKLSAILRRSVGGTSGALYAAGILRAAATLERHEEPAALHWAEALAAAATGIAELGDARPGDRTMLDALLPATDTLRRAIADGAHFPLRAAIAAAETGAASTESIPARRGRTSYLGAHAIGTRDPGAEAVVVWLRAISRGLGT